MMSKENKSSYWGNVISNMVKSWMCHVSISMFIKDVEKRFQNNFIKRGCTSRDQEKCGGLLFFLQTLSITICLL